MKELKIVKICFVCLGNICRSPLAHGLLESLVAKEGLSEKILIDSAGTGNWHVGEKPDPRMSETASKRGITLNSTAKQFTSRSFRAFDLILAMDQVNMKNLMASCRNEKETQLTVSAAKEKLKLFRSFDPIKGELDVPDPYYGGENGFNTVFNIVSRTCPKILEYVKARFSLSQ